MRPDPLFQIRACAQDIILRDSGFWGLVVVMVTIAFADDPALALAAGGILNLLWCAALLICAARAAHRDYRRTEVWQVLRKQLDMPARTAQIVFSHTLRSAYLRFARLSGLAAALFLALASLWYAAMTFHGSAAAGQSGETFYSATGPAATVPGHPRH